MTEQEKRDVMAVVADVRRKLAEISGWVAEVGSMLSDIEDVANGVSLDEEAVYVVAAGLTTIDARNWPSVEDRQPWIRRSGWHPEHPECTP